MKHLMTASVFLLVVLSVQAQQDTLYLDAQQNVVRKRAKAVELALVDEPAKEKTVVSFYTLEGRLTRISEYKRFRKVAAERILHGPTHYKFAGGTQDSVLVFYAGGVRNGGIFFYYPDGKLMAQGVCKGGLLNGLLQQFYPDGKIKRQEVYEKGVSQGGSYLSPEGAELEFSPFWTPAEYTGGMDALERIVAQEMRLPRDLLKHLGTSRNSTAKADVAILVNERGEAVGLSVLNSTSSKFDERSFSSVIPALEGKIFLPGMMDGKPVSSFVLLKDIMCQVRSVRM